MGETLENGGNVFIADNSRRVFTLTRWIPAPVLSLRAPEAEEILNDNFQGLLEKNLAVKWFAKFCLEEYTLEYLLFWISVESFEECKDADQNALWGDCIIRITLTSSYFSSFHTRRLAFTSFQKGNEH